MQPYQRKFIEFAVQQQALLFGEFKIKSGRISPYFFNAGCFNNGEAIARLGQFYAHAIQHSGVQYDVLFGPAYKGIALVTATAVALTTQHGVNKPYCFNRKEPKAHGEGGMIVGAPLHGRVLIVDDVISSGKTTREVVAIMRNAQVEIAAMVISLDRQERGTGHLSAVDEVEKTYGIPIIRIVTLTDVIDYLEEAQPAQVKLMRQYQEHYGVKVAVG